MEPRSGNLNKLDFLAMMVGMILDAIECDLIKASFWRLGSSCQSSLS